MAPLPQVALFLGSWDLATHADLILQGLLFAQFAHYWTQYRSDHLPIKLFVVGLCIATTVKSAHAIAILWVQNVEYFMDLQRALGIFADPSLGGVHLLLIALITIYVQSFFLHRLWLLSKKTYFVSCLAVLFLFSAIAAIVTIVYSSSGTLTDDHTSLHFNSQNTWIAIQLATVVAGDVLLCASTLYFLMIQSRNALPQTVGILHRLMRLAFQSAAPGALCASVVLICDLYYNLQGRLDAALPLLVISSMMLPKLYAISAMWTLNSRHGLRSHFATTIASDSQPTVSGKLGSDMETTMIQFSSNANLPPLQGADSETLAESAEHTGYGKFGRRGSLAAYPEDVNQPKLSCSEP